jgi:hypothetical protein
MRETFFTYLPVSLVLVALGSLAGCDATTVPKQAGVLATDGEVVAVSRPPVEASTLEVSELTISQTRTGGLTVASAYVAASGSADHVEVSVCYSGFIKDAQGKQTEKTGCDAVKKEAANRFAFPPFPNGKVTFKVRACVDAVRAKTPGVLCGPWKDTSWMQPPNENGALNELLARRASIQAELADMGADIKQALKSFEKQTEICLRRKVGAESLMRTRAIVQNATQLGDAVFSHAMSQYGMRRMEAERIAAQQRGGADPISSVDTKPVVDAVQKNAGTIDGSRETLLDVPLKEIQNAPSSSTVALTSDEAASFALYQQPCPVGTVAGVNGSCVQADVNGQGFRDGNYNNCPQNGQQMGSGYCPATYQTYNMSYYSGGQFGILGTVVNGIMGLATASAEIDANRPCFAQSTAQTEIRAANQRIATLRASLREVEDKIKAAGGG